MPIRMEKSFRRTTLIENVVVATLSVVLKLELNYFLWLI